MIHDRGRIRAVFFDLYNTLARFHPPREDIQTQAARDFGMELSTLGIVRGYIDADHFMTQQNARRHVSRLPPEERQTFFARYEQLILKGAGHDVSEEMAGRVWARVRQIPNRFTPFDDAIPTLKDIKERRLTVAVISNINQDLDQLTRDMGIAPYLDFVVTSQSAGAEKPHPKIFLMALEKAGIQPGEAIHVGDQYHGDVAGARGVGIHPILLDRDRLLGEYADVDRIHRLDEVLRFLT